MVVGGTVLADDENEEEKRLCLFRNNRPIGIQYTIIDKTAFSSNKSIVESRTMQPISVDGLVATVMKCLLGRRKLLLVSTESVGSSFKCSISE